MSVQANTTPDERHAPQAAPANISAIRLFAWSVRRELWEYRSIYLAPLAIAGTILLAFPFVLFHHLSHIMRAFASLDSSQQRDALAQPYDVAAGLIMAAAFIVSVFYSVDCLHGERRDRSILFWKSLPVSDLTTVLAKAAVPLFVLPMLAFVITVVVQSIMFLLSSLVLLASGLSVATLWAQLQLPQTLLMLLYHLVTAHMLWYAPFYAWLLLVSAWARRTPFLWAVMPPLVIGVFEKIAFHHSYLADLLNYRYSGGDEAMSTMMGDMPFHPGMHISPGAFLAAPGLWGGLLVAAIFLFAAARVRRYRGPV